MGLLPSGERVVVSATIRQLIIAVIASIMAIVGMELIALRKGNHTDLENLKMVVPLSIVVWTVFSLMLRQRPVVVGAGVGFFSPSLGGLLVFPPYGILIVLTNLAICIGVGITTGLLVALVLRRTEEW